MEANSETISKIMIPTKVIRSNRVVRDLFLECGRAQVQPLLFVDRNGRLKGRLTRKKRPASLLPARIHANLVP